LGVAWPAAQVDGHALAHKVVASACGVPPAILSDNADGTASREALRQFLHSSVTPVANCIVEELRAKLDAEFGMSFEELHAADVQGRARAFASLVGSGETPHIEVAEARRLTGLT